MHTDCMEEKKTFWDKYSLWTVFSSGYIHSAFLGRKYFSKNNVGFTLIELLIVIAVIGVLAVGLIMALDPVTQLQKANDTKRKSDLSQIQKALEIYYNDNGKYPLFVATNGQFSDIRYVIKNLDNNPVNWGDPWQPYMSIMPKDPSSPSRDYAYLSNGESYWLYASLERGNKDSQACNKNSSNGGPCAGGILPAQKCGPVTGACNYDVSSPNVSP